MYWGDSEGLLKTIKAYKEWSDDICVAIIDVVPCEAPYGVPCVHLPFRHVWDFGYARGKNMASELCSNEYVYIGSPNKRIVELDKDVLCSLGTRFSSFPVKYDGKDHKWYWLYSVDKTKWVGKIHEEIVPFVGEAYPDTVGEWTRIEFKQQNENEDFICKVYRDLARIKWLHELHIGHYRDYGTNKAWWEESGLVDFDRLERMYRLRKDIIDNCTDEYEFANILDNKKNWEFFMQKEGQQEIL